MHSQHGPANIDTSNNPTTMQVHAFLDLDTGRVELCPVDSDSDTPVATYDINVIMDGVTVEVVTRSGGPHDICDIIDTEDVAWSRCGDDDRMEVTEYHVRRYAAERGYMVNAFETL